MVRTISTLAFCILFLLQHLTAQDFSYSEKKELKGFPEYTMEASYSPYKNYFAVCIGNNTIEISDRNWKKVFSYQGNPRSVGGHVAWSPNERYLAYAKYKSDNDVAIIRIPEMKVTQILLGHEMTINDLEFSHNGRFLATCSSDNTIKVWELKNEQFELLQTLTEHTDNVKGISFSYDDRFLASTGNDSKVIVWELKQDTYKPYDVVSSFRGYNTDVCFHPKNYDLLVGTYYGLVRLRPGKKGFERVDSLPEVKVNYSIHYSPVGDFAVLGQYELLKIIRTSDKVLEEYETIYRHNDQVFGGFFSEDGKNLLSYGSDKNVVIWELNGLRASDRSLIANYLDNSLSEAQKKVLTPSNVGLLIKTLDPSLTEPRDEFETSQDFAGRQKKLADEVLSQIQLLIEKQYQLEKTNDALKLRIPLQRLVGYNADVQVYKLRFLDTDAGVEIPINEARSLKQNPEKAYIQVTKQTRKGKKSFSYGSFQLIHPVSGKSYQLTPLENPFLLKNDEEERGTGENQQIEQHENPTVINNKPGSTSEGHLTRALLFATNLYDSYEELTNPVLDAGSISDELQQNYGVETEVVLNPTLNETINKIRAYAEMNWTPEDQLVIFFAGHGMYDDVFKEGYIISRDSKADDMAKTSYLSHSNLRTIANNIPCNHILLVMDVCFGGTFDQKVASHRGASDLYKDIPKEEYIERKLEYKTRLYLTSGGKEYVPDGRPGQHSPFARNFLDALRNFGGQDGILTISEILSYVEKTNPQPHLGEFGDNEPGSDFLLITK
jgi:WD40 repeat protein